MYLSWWACWVPVWELYSWTSEIESLSPSHLVLCKTSQNTSERTAPKGYKLYKYKSISQFKKKNFNLENSLYYYIPGATYSCRNYYEKQNNSTMWKHFWRGFKVKKSESCYTSTHWKLELKNSRSTNLAIKLTSISISNKAVPNISSSVPMKVETTLFQNIGQES